MRLDGTRMIGVLSEWVGDQHFNPHMQHALVCALVQRSRIAEGDGIASSLAVLCNENALLLWCHALPFSQGEPLWTGHRHCVQLVVPVSHLPARVISPHSHAVVP